MSPFKKVLAKVSPFQSSKHTKDTRSHTTADHQPQENGDASSPRNSELRSEPPKTAAQRQQENGDASNVHNSDLKRQPSIEKLEKRQQREVEEEAVRSQSEAKHREAYERDELKANYGNAPQTETKRASHTFTGISQQKEGDAVQFRARIHHSRPVGPKIAFLIFRQKMSTLQGILTEQEGVVSENMVQWAKRLHDETIVLVDGVVQAPKDGQKEVKSTTVHNVEVKIQKIYVVAEPTVTLPFQVRDADKAATGEEKESNGTRVSERTRLNNRVLDLRAPTSQAIFRIHSGICRLFRSYLDSQDFTEISSSKLQESATESGASVFKVDYFRRPAFLAQSPQLAKQMCIAGDMERVYEIGPVFRAENSNTHRHMTEFIGLDLEMAFDSHYSEVIDMLDSMLLHIFRGLQSQYRDEIEIVKKHYPHDDLVFPEKTLRLKFHEGAKLLRDSGWKEDGSEPGDYDDLSTKGEQRLGQIIKEKYNTDYYILDKFPLALRPFYTMPDPEDDRVANSCDFFLRGEEILSGGQRIHDARFLEERMKEAGIDPNSMKEYVDGFRWGCPPHGGGGIGLERVLMLFLHLHNVRWASLFPRDPRSFAKPEQDVAEAAADAAQSTLVHGPKARTVKGNLQGDLPELSELIAKYGDATNTSWVDPAWTVWRHPSTGAAVGYIPSDGVAVTFGNPLCEPDQFGKVIRAYLEHIQGEKGLKPVWCCVDKETERYLAQDLGWSAVIAVAEERLNPTEVSIEEDKNARRKIHRAEREGVKLHEVVGEPEEGFREEVAQRLKEWESNRKGTQIHLTGLRPFDDAEHRRYYYATDKNGKICCLVVLAQLAPTHGVQIKWSLEFPGAPTGAIEYILSDVIKKVGEAGVRSATFGAGATGNLQKVDHVGGLRVLLLEKTYNGLSHTFSLTNKGDFRSKFGVKQDPLYICYPKGALGATVESLKDGLLTADHSLYDLGAKGINTIMSVLQKPK